MYFFIVLIVLMVSLLALVILLAGYPDYLYERGSQNACEEEFGEDATFRGEVGGWWSSGDGVFCDVGGELKTTEGRSAPMNLETLGDYLEAVGEGEE